MRLERITLKQYRNYTDLDVEFDRESNINIFVGENGQGKTNLLESISMLAFAKSFRNTESESLIKKKNDFTRIVGHIRDESGEISLEYFMSSAPLKKKNLRKNGADIGVKDFIGQFNVVIFHPEDLNMLTLSPALRRKYLNAVLSQTDPFYFDSLVQYNRALKHRNKLLFLVDLGNAKKDQLAVWDNKLAEYGVYLTKKRIEFIEFIGGILEGNYKKIADSDDKISVEYIRSLETNELTEKDYLEQLNEVKDKDLKYGQTRKGIHRDDIGFLFNGHNIEQFGSRGEMRTLILALKLAEMDYIEKQTGSKPVLLLDDVFSELDINRQKFLLERISEHQSLVTTTHSNFVLENAKIYKIENGGVVQRNA